MSVPRKTKKNPHQLTAKQMLFVDMIADNIANNRGLRLGDTAAAIYDAKTKTTAATIASENMHKPNIREALLDQLKKKNIIGPEGKVEQRLIEGLDATSIMPNGTKIKQFDTRLRYIQEINKIAGVYAPLKSSVSKMNLNLNVPEDQLNSKIKNLMNEFQDAEIIENETEHFDNLELGENINDRPV